MQQRYILHKKVAGLLTVYNGQQVPLYALLLFGGPVSVNHIAGGVTIRSKDSWVKLKAWPRIGILVNQLRSVYLSLSDGSSHSFKIVVCWMLNCNTVLRKEQCSTSGRTIWCRKRCWLF